MAGTLAVLAFFFLLRVGEYTPGENRRTIPLRKRDVKLWSGDIRVPLDAPWAALSSATAVTITLENQKNGHRGCILHHYASLDDTLCPVKAMVAILWAIKDDPLDTALGSFHHGGYLCHVSASQMRKLLRSHARVSQLQAQGYDIDRIGNHSLRSGGAVALKLAGYDTDIIKKLGRWSSNTYLLHIQSQIAQLTAGVAQRMGRRLQFQTVG